jgi:DNA gyrase subunit A
VSDVRETGRNAQGVKLVTLNKGEKLQAVARVMPDDESDEESEEGEIEVAEDSGSDS